MIGQAVRVHNAGRGRAAAAASHENTQLRQELRERYDFRNIVGNSRPMQQVYEQVAQVAPTNTTVLIRGRVAAPARS